MVANLVYFLSLVLGLWGLKEIDFTLYEGLNYFGKYVFFAIFNIAIFYSFYYLYKQKPIIKIVGSIILGSLLFAGGIGQFI